MPTTTRSACFSVEEETDLVRIKGFVGKPEHARKTRGEQYLFVNGRFIKHPALSAAVERAYDDLLPDRSHPSYFIALQVDPARIDINIHPNKTEVRFVDDHALFAILRSAVKKALGQFTLATELSFDTPPEFNLAPAPSGYIPQQPKISYNPDYNPFRPSPTQTRIKLDTPNTLPDLNDPLLTPHSSLLTPHSSLLTPHSSLPTTPCLQLQDRYIATALSSGLALIDRQRALERILYDRLTPTSELRTPNSQTLLFPINCQFSAADAELLGELLPDLQDYGFALEAVGQTTFVVTATPADVQEANLQPFFEQLLADYKASTLQKFCDRGQSLRAALARQMAARATSPLSQEEMQQLVADLFACPMADTTPGGKRIITIVKPEEIFK